MFLILLVSFVLDYTNLILTSENGHDSQEPSCVLLFSTNFCTLISFAYL